LIYFFFCYILIIGSKVLPFTQYMGGKKVKKILGAFVLISLLVGTTNTSYAESSEKVIVNSNVISNNSLSADLPHQH
jgi:hypothetical protein